MSGKFAVWCNRCVTKSHSLRDHIWFACNSSFLIAFLLRFFGHCPYFSVIHIKKIINFFQYVALWNDYHSLGKNFETIDYQYLDSTWFYPIPSMGLVYLPTFGWFLWFSCRSIYQSHGSVTGTCFVELPISMTRSFFGTSDGSREEGFCNFTKGPVFIFQNRHILKRHIWHIQTSLEDFIETHLGKIFYEELDTFIVWIWSWMRIVNICFWFA